MIKWKNITQSPIKQANAPKSIDTFTLSAHPVRGRKKKTSLDSFKYKNSLYIEFYKIPLLNTSCLTLAKWEDYCWKTQGIMWPPPSPWWMSGLHSGTHTALFSTEDADFQRCEGSEMKTLAFISPLPLLGGSLPNSNLKEILKWSHHCLVMYQWLDDVIVSQWWLKCSSLS